MAVKLRDDLRKYEVESDKKFKCRISHIRCLNCPGTWVSCPLARRWLTEDIKKGV